MKTAKRLWHYLKGSRRILFLTLFFALLADGSKLYIPILAGRAIDLMIGLNQVDFPAINAIIALIGILIVVGMAFRYLFDYFTDLMGQCVVKNMRDELGQAYNDAPIAYIDSHYHGDLLLRATSDVENVQVGLVSGFSALYDGLVAISFTIVFMFMLNWVLAIVVICLTPISVAVSKVISSKNSKFFKAQAKDAGSLNSLTNECLANSAAARALDLQAGEEARFAERNDVLRKDNFKATFAAAWINPATRLVNSFIYAIVAVAGALLVLDGSAIGLVFEVGELSAFLIYCSHYMQPFNDISNVVSELSYALASFRRLDEAVTAPRDPDEGTKTLNEPVAYLEAKDIHFSYDPSREIIKGFSLDIYQGHKIALVGTTGCGKTTIINLLMRFYDPQSGSFYFNRLPSLDYKKSEIRKHIGMVLQETWLFKGSVYENVGYGKLDSTREEIVEACVKANADGFIRRLPNGYDTVIDNEAAISIGEKQLLCIARVMLLSPEIVILDEATSNIDTRTEKKVNAAFDILMKGKTSLVVAHRLSTIRTADLILVMRDGAIVEQGNHRELLAQDGFYAKLYHSQFQ